jgi:hypothetical protein
VCVILKEHRYVVQVGAVRHMLRIEELVSGPALWRAKFRLHIPADPNSQAQTLYGASAEEVAELGADFLGGRKPRLNRLMSTSRFKKLGAEFEVLKIQFNRCTDSAQRNELLVKLSLVINEIDSLIIEQLEKIQPKN